MPTYADHSDIPFVESRMVTGGPAYTKGRPDGPPIWVVVHDMEFPERDDAAEWTAAYFARGADGRSVSSHYTADASSIVQCVRLADVAWTVGNRPGNYRGINWELAGYASQTREQWLDAFGTAMLTRIAEIMRRDMARYAIPARLLDDMQVRSFTPGITSHVQLGRCFAGTDHTDPGRGFPWDVLVGLIEGDNDVQLSDKLSNGMTVNNALVTLLARAPYDLVGRLDELKTILAAAADPTDPTTIDTQTQAKLDEILTALTTSLPDAVDALPDAVADKLTQRLGD